MQSTRKQVEQVLGITLILNLLVAVGKILIGIASGALAITADGIHSLTDSAGNVVGLIAIRIADRPPDDDHPYGHGKFETLSALLIGGLLLLTAWEMVQGIVGRLTDGESPTLTPLTFAVLIGTLLVNIVVSRYQIRRGEQLQSQILLGGCEKYQRRCVCHAVGHREYGAGRIGLGMDGSGDCVDCGRFDLQVGMGNPLTDNRACWWIKLPIRLNICVRFCRMCHQCNTFYGRAVGEHLVIY